VLAVTDAVVLAHVVHCVSFVIGAEMTRWRLAERAIETLQAGHPRSIARSSIELTSTRNRYYYSRYTAPVQKLLPEAPSRADLASRSWLPAADLIAVFS
jgi:hypothetical protein